MQMSFKKDRLYIDGVAANWLPAHHTGGSIRPTLIVPHHTASRLGKFKAAKYLARRNARKVSVHFTIERDGTVTQHASPRRRCNHAGRSSWKGRSGCNNFSLGIELVGPGKVTKSGRSWAAWFGKLKPQDGYDPSTIKYVKSPTHRSGYYLPFTPEQIEACTELCRALKAHYKTIKDIAGHYEISPGRKNDPNPTLNMNAFRAAVDSGASMEESEPEVEWPLSMYLSSEGPRVERAYAELKRLGFLAGKDDGIFGALMRDATLAWQATNDLKITGALYEADFTYLMTGESKGRELEDDRVMAGVEDVAESETVKTAQVGQKAGSGLKWLGLGGAGF